MATPTQTKETVVYDVSYQGKMIAIETQTMERCDIFWIEHLSRNQLSILRLSTLLQPGG
jgi:hypothetical protein